jgi:hypothetical protein
VFEDLDVEFVLEGREVTVLAVVEVAAVNISSLARIAGRDQGNGVTTIWLVDFPSDGVWHIFLAWERH